MGITEMRGRQRRRKGSKLDVYKNALREPTCELVLKQDLYRDIDINSWGLSSQIRKQTRKRLWGVLTSNLIKSMSSRFSEKPCIKGWRAFEEADIHLWLPHAQWSYVLDTTHTCACAHTERISVNTLKLWRQKGENIEKYKRNIWREKRGEGSWPYKPK